MSASPPKRNVNSEELRGEMKKTGLLAIPLILGHLLSGLIGFTDAVLAGHHGTTTLAAVSVGNAFYWLPMMIPIGVLMALPPLVSEMHGANRSAAIGPLFRQAIWLAVMLGASLFLLITGLASLLDDVGIASEIQPGARDFLLAIRWGIPGFTLYLCMRYLSDGVHWTIPTMVFGFGGIVILVPIGYTLMFGHFGLPEMGAKGLGIATAIMLWIQTIAFAIYLVMSKRYVQFELFTQFDWPNWREIYALLRLGLPIGVTVAMEGSLFIVTSILIGRLGEVPAAAHQIAINVASLCFMIPYGFAEATTVRVGHAMGRGDGRDGVRKAIYAGLALILITQLVSCLLLIIGNHAVAGIYSSDAAVISLAASLILLAAIFQFPDGIQVVAAGALRGLKDTKKPMVLAFIAYWLIGMPIGAGLGLGLGWGPKGMWIGLIAGLTCAAVLLTRRMLKTTSQLTH